MANNQIQPTFLNFANNVSLSQNKWNDTRLHQNKGCYYNNLLSPFWKKKESYTGIPFEIGNNVYKIDNHRLLKNNIEILSDIPDGYTYDILSYEVLNAFSNYGGKDNYRFYKTANNEIKLDYNDTVVTLNIPGDDAKYKVIQIPTKTDYQASFGILVILKTSSKITAKFYEVHFADINNITIESTSSAASTTDEYTEYCVVGGLVYNGSWAGFSVFSQSGWIMHDKEPVNFLVNLNNLTQFKWLQKGTGSNGSTNKTYGVIYNGSNDTMNNLAYAGNFHVDYDSEYFEEYHTRISYPTFEYTNNAVSVNTHAKGVAIQQSAAHYFCKYSENAITINNTSFPVYGIEMWVSEVSRVRYIFIGNNITGITWNTGSNITAIYFDSKRIVYPYTSCNLLVGRNYDSAGDRAFNLKFASDFQGYFSFTYDSHVQTVPSSPLSATIGVLKIGSSSYISEDYQENVYCGYFTNQKSAWVSQMVTPIPGQPLPSITIQTLTIGTDNLSEYFSYGYTCGTVKENMNVYSSKTFNNLTPGDNVYDPNPKLWKSPDNFYLAIGSEGSVQNVLTEHGNALMQWQNIDNLKFGENGVIYGRFLNNNQWFKIKKCEPYIVSRINNYLLINTDGLNAFNYETDIMNKCWAIGYNSAFDGAWSDTASYTELSNHSVSAMPSVKVFAGAVNNHPEVKNDYFTGATYNFVKAYNFADYTIGNNPFIYDIEFYKGAGTNPVYSSSTYAESSNTYNDIDLSGFSYLFSGVLYSWFLCNFSVKYFYNRFGIIDLGNNIKTNIRYLNEVYVVSQYSLNSLLEEIENIFIIQGQIYAIKKGYVYSLILAADFSISYQNPITECTNLQLVGNTSKYAIFFSPLTKAIYSFTGSQIFEYMQDASDIQSVITWENNQYMNISLISYLSAENKNKVLLIQNDYSSIIWEDTDDLEDLTEGNVTNILIEQNKIYFVTSSQNVYAVMFYDNLENYSKITLEFESETLLNDFSQNIIDCVYVQVSKKDKMGKVKVFLISGEDETSQEFNLKNFMKDRNGLSHIRFQPKYQQRGRVAIRVESEVPLENIAYTVKPVGNEISHKLIEI